jgi:GNAT superfamily N-acetyltransferase
MEIILYKPALAAEAAALQAHHWGPDVSLNSRYLEWKYHRNPYLAEPVIALARAEGQLVGMVGMYGTCWEAGTPPRLVPGACTGDWVVAPAHRRGGLARRLMSVALEELAARGVTHAFTLSAGEVTSRICVESGWRSIGSLLPVERSARGLLGRAVRRVRRMADSREDVYGRLDRHLGQPPGRPLPITVGTRPRASAMAELKARRRGDGRIRHVTDSAYFEWRYQNPFSRYRFLCWDDDGGLEGYLVLQTSVRRPEAQVRIVDWEAAHSAVRAGLLRTALDWGRFARLSVWSASLPAEAQEMLAAAGFEPVRRAETPGAGDLPTVLVRPTCGEDLANAGRWTFAGVPLLARGAWDVSMVDSDGF